MPDVIERVSGFMRSSQMLRLLTIGFLVLLLQIPIGMIGGLVEEREQRSEQAVREVSSKWGNEQSLVGPALVVPYTYRWTESTTDGKQIIRDETRYGVFLPNRLQVRGTAASQVRKRGIFSVPVYELRVAMEGSFSRPDFSNFGVQPAAVAWDRAHVVIGIADVRAIQEETAVAWGDSGVSFVPGTGAFPNAGTGIHAVVGFPDGLRAVEFAIPLALNGSEALYFAPFGQSTIVEITSNYAHPSFQGNWLPVERTISSAGFAAKWSIPFLGRSFPQAWAADDDMSRMINESRFGVNLLGSVDHYRMAERSVKYASLFVLLTFAALWLLEVLAGMRVHPIQYLLLGGALCLFYLLELSISEHLGFPVAYALASMAVLGMVTAYAAVVLRSVLRALGVGLGVALLYAYLYVLLMNEDYALLIGSFGLFIILAAIMFATRRVDWYVVGARPAHTTEPQR